jgi:hypothetical protein
LYTHTHTHRCTQNEIAKILPTSILFLFPKKQGIKQPCLLHFTPTTGAAKDETLLIHQQSSRQPTGSNNRYATKEGDRGPKRKGKKKEENIPQTAPHCTAPFPLHRDPQPKQKPRRSQAKTKTKKKGTKQSADGDRDCRNLRDEMRSHPCEMKIRMKLR